MGKPTALPFGAEIRDDGIWVQLLNRVQGPGRRPALFLDRDGVMVEEVHYLHKVEDVRLATGITDVIARAHAAGLGVVVVTNQAGIGRGIFDWPQFIAVQEHIHDALAAAGVFVHAVYACPHHANGQKPYDKANHPHRKPNPGMLLDAADQLGLDLGRSWIIGDRAGDMGAGRNAGLAGGLHVLSGHGGDAGERAAALALHDAAFEVRTAPGVAAALDRIPILRPAIGD